jgi:hypothetical protein
MEKKKKHTCRKIHCIIKHNLFRSADKLRRSGGQTALVVAASPSLVSACPFQVVAYLKPIFNRFGCDWGSSPEHSANLNPSISASPQNTLLKIFPKVKIINTIKTSKCEVEVVFLYKISTSVLGIL